MKYTLFFILLLIANYSLGQTQSEMNQQASESFLLADKKMTKVYQTLMARLSTQTEKDLLLTTQRAWIKYKEAHCKAIAYQYEGGSIQPLVLCGCLEDLTNERIENLNAYE